MNLHARRSKPSELLLLRFGGVERARDKESETETARAVGGGKGQSVLTSLNERKLSVSARSKIN